MRSRPASQAWSRRTRYRRHPCFNRRLPRGRRPGPPALGLRLPLLRRQGRPSSLPSTPPARPAPLFVSHGEFIAFGCRGGASTAAVRRLQHARRRDVGARPLRQLHLRPTFAFAPAAGRFALSRVLDPQLRQSPTQPISADEISAQTVVVYQTDSGKQLLRVDCSPVDRAGQNFALSPDGLDPRRRPRRRRRDLRPPAPHRQGPGRSQTRPDLRPRKTNSPSA